VRDAASGTELARLNHDDGLWAVAFSPNGTRLATASGDRSAWVWDASSGAELVRLEHEGRVWAVAFSVEI
jgi:WD40 repeat protein